MVGHGCRSNGEHRRSHTCRADAAYAGTVPFGGFAAERCRVHAPGGCTFMYVGSSEAGKFRASDTKLGVPEQFDKAFNLPCEISC